MLVPGDELPKFGLVNEGSSFWLLKENLVKFWCRLTILKPQTHTYTTVVTAIFILFFWLVLLGKFSSSRFIVMRIGTYEKDVSF